MINATVDDPFDESPANLFEGIEGVWLHPREGDRLESLRSYNVEQNPCDAALREVAKLAAAVCDAPAAVVSLIECDYQWSAASHGMLETTTRTPRIDSICSDAVATESNLVLEDTTAHARYARTVLVAGEPHIQAYAGVPLIGRDGLPLGTLCVLDWHPRKFSDVQIEHLEIVAEQVVVHLELRRADRASGRSGEQVLNDALDARRLRHGIEHGEFTVQFQPIMNMRTEAVIAIEALVRWNHPELGMVPPALFLPAMEQTGLMIPLGRHVLESTLKVASKMRKALGDSPLPTFNVNVSGSELRSPGLAAAIESELSRYGLEPRMLCIEVTETMSLPGPLAIQELEKIRALGVYVALDDFGSGTATLGQVETIPANVIKIDRELVLAAERSPRGRQILHSACELARSLHLEYCVEGIETAAQRDLLLEEGVVHGQGWLYSSALNTQALFAYVKAKGTSLPSPLA